MNAFEQFKMIEIVEGIITIPNWNKHQTLDAYERKKSVTGCTKRKEEPKQRSFDRKIV